MCDLGINEFSARKEQHEKINVFQFCEVLYNLRNRNLRKIYTRRSKDVLLISLVDGDS